VTLFVPSTRRVEITTAGREFVGIAERMLKDIQFALSNMRDLATEQRGQVIISTFPIFAQQITYGHSSPEAVERTDLRREPICVILPRAHPLARSAKPIRLAQLRNVPLISLPRESYRRLFEGAAATAGVSLRHAVLVPEFLEMISQVRAGVRVGVLPHIGAADSKQAVGQSGPLAGEQVRLKADTTYGVGSGGSLT
jgi:DNA-binding transcriptional LysR family regulator